MVRAFLPQGSNTSIGSNTNNPPQGIEPIPDVGENDMIFENSNVMLFENANTMEYE